jgi:hypothetical protein
MDHEQIYQWAYQEDWRSLLEFVNKNRHVAVNDEQIKAAIKTAENAFFFKNSEPSKEKKEELLERFYLLHEGKTYRLSDQNYESLIVELVKARKDKGRLEEAYSYAKKSPQNAFCIEVICQYEATLPQKIQHTQEGKIKVTRPDTVSPVSSPSSLFKSQQENDFFMAVRDVFQLYLVYPNVALKTLVDFDKIKDYLNQEEKEFYFKGLVDCVVFENSGTAYDGYKPKHVFELDSLIHSDERRKQNDAYKDKILALCGLTAIRIEKTKFEKSAASQRRSEFATLIREILKGSM